MYRTPSLGLIRLGLHHRCHAVLVVPPRGAHEGGSYSDCVGGVVGPLCTFCLVLTYLLLHLRLRGGICPAVPSVVVPKLGCTSRLTYSMLAHRDCESTKVDFRE